MARSEAEWELGLVRGAGVGGQRCWLRPLRAPPGRACSGLPRGGPCRCEQPPCHTVLRACEPARVVRDVLRESIPSELCQLLFPSIQFVSLGVGPMPLVAGLLVLLLSPPPPRAARPCRHQGQQGPASRCRGSPGAAARPLPPASRPPIQCTYCGSSSSTGAGVAAVVPQARELSEHRRL